jgi:hypothetical protein
MPLRMIARLAAALGTVGFVGCSLTGSGAVEDELRIAGLKAGESVVVMLKARTAEAGCRDGRNGDAWVFRSTGRTRLGNVLSARNDCVSEIVIASENHAMLVEAVNTWTDAPGDVHTVTLSPVIYVPITIWVTHPLIHSADWPKTEVRIANELFKKNRVGIELVPDYRHVWDNESAVKLIRNGIEDNPLPDCLDGIEAVGKSAFYMPGTLNVYYVHMGFRGRNCALKRSPKQAECPAAGYEVGDGNITYRGFSVETSILVHELGHAFGLRPADCGGHTNKNIIDGFNDENIMWQGGTERKHFSLGQVFRMNTHVDQWGGTMLIKNGLRAGPPRACPPRETSSLCPALRTDFVEQQ